MKRAQTNDKQTDEHGGVVAYIVPCLLDGLNVPQSHNFLQLKFVVVVQSQEVDLFSTSATK